jgi:DNA modification methylase
MGRKAIMYEKQERYAEMAKKRIALVAKEFNSEQAEYLESIGKAKIDITHFANPSLDALKKARRKKAA